MKKSLYASKAERYVEKFAGLYTEITTDSTAELYARAGIDLKSIAELKA